jgi:hypothetical protein
MVDKNEQPVNINAPVKFKRSTTAAFNLLRETYREDGRVT